MLCLSVIPNSQLNLQLSALTQTLKSWNVFMFRYKNHSAVKLVGNSYNYGYGLSENLCFACKKHTCFWC